MKVLWNWVRSYQTILSGKTFFIAFQPVFKFKVTANIHVFIISLQNVYMKYACIVYTTVVINVVALNVKKIHDSN